MMKTAQFIHFGKDTSTRGWGWRGIATALLALTILLVAGYAVYAQTGGTMVTVMRVESESFPQVTAYASVYDESGPRSGLTASNFHVLEEGTEIASTAVQVTSDDTQETRLVLALDTSMGDPAAFARMKEAAKGFFGRLKPADKAALLTYGDQATFAVTLTDDKARLQKAVDGLTIRGSLTNYNQAAYDGLTALEPYPGRKTLILVTDSGDHYRKKTVDEIIAKAQSNAILVYVIGFNQFRINQEDSKKMTAATGGMLFLPTQPVDMPKSFQTIEQLLRQGVYKISYLSNLQADNQKHNLTIGVVYQGRVGQSKSSFTALPGPVKITVSGLTEGGKVSGTVRVSAQVKAPADVAAVEFWLGDKVLAERTSAPFTYEWDTTAVKPGDYAFVVKGRDKAGNKGETKTNLSVVAPIVLEATASAGFVKAGEAVKISTRVETVDAIERVELLVDDRLADSDSTMPFEFNLNSQGYATGAHTLTVRVVDSAGRQKDIVLPLQIQPAPVVKRAPTTVNYLILVGSGLAGLIVLALMIVALVLFVRWQKRRLRQVRPLRLANLGNLFTSYELTVEEKTKALKFEFFQSGQKLAETAKTFIVGREPGRESIVEPARPRAVSETSSGVSAGQSVRQAGGFIARIGFFLGSLLPGSAGAAAQRASSTAYRMEMEISEAERMKGLVTHTSPSGMETSQPSYSAGRSTTTTGDSFITRQAMITQTTVIDPGDSIVLDLQISPVNAYRAGTYFFEITSRVSGQEGGDTVQQQGSVTMQGINWFWRLLPYFGFVALAAIIIALTAWLVVWYWMAYFA